MTNDIRHKLNKTNLSKFENNIIGLYLILAFNPDFASKDLVLWPVILVIVFLLFLKCMKSKVVLSLYTFYIFFFLIIVGMSFMWSLNEQYTLAAIKSVFKNFIILIYLSIAIKNKKDIYCVLKKYYIATVLTALYIIFNVVKADMFGVRISYNVLGESWNPNTFGVMLAFGVFVSFLLLQSENRKSIRLIYQLSMFLVVAIVLFTGSRKAFFTVVFTNGLYYFLIYRKRQYKKIFMMIFAGFILLYMVMNVPPLYNVLGYRLDTLFDFISGKGTTETSILDRTNMIKLGYEWFKEKPILGYGMNNSQDLYYSFTGRAMYLHNNYFEVLVGIGIVGTLFYYSMYIVTLKRAFKCLRNSNTLSAFAFTTILTILIIEIGQVSYSYFYIQLFILLSYYSVRMAESNGS